MCFVLVKNLPTNLEPVWKVLGEHNDRLYKHLVKHFDDPEELHNLLREMAHGTTWPVDCWNEIEQASLKKRQNDGFWGEFHGISWHPGQA